MIRTLHTGFLLTLSAALLVLPLRAQEPADTWQRYIVQRGDTLFRIALNHNSTVEAFAELNDLANPSLIFVGQQLLVPGGDALAPAPVLPDYVAPLFNPHSSAFLVHTVQKGDTLSEIAADFGLSLDALVARNAIADAALLHVGQQVYLPGLESGSLELPTPAVALAMQYAPATLLQGDAVRFHLQTATEAQVSGNFLGIELSFAADETGHNHLAFTGIPRYTDPGLHLLALEVDAGSQLTSLRWLLPVDAGIFGREAVKLPAEDQESLDRETENAELALLQQAASVNRPGRWFNGLLLRPADGRITSRFGTLRSYNGGPYDRLHNGVDFAAGTGAPVRAVADGLVVLSADLNVRGQSIMLDHGLGVYSGYWHLSAMDVEVGEFVRAGDAIGAVGNSGRSTGSHLHWELWVNGTPVDPLPWLRADFTALGSPQE